MKSDRQLRFYVVRRRGLFLVKDRQIDNGRTISTYRDKKPAENLARWLNSTDCILKLNPELTESGD